MKRFWHSWMAVIATVAMISPAVAQNDLGQSSEIGSYQSILSRSGYSMSGYGSAAGRTTDGWGGGTVPSPPSNGAFRPPYTQDAAGATAPANSAEAPAAPMAPASPQEQAGSGEGGGMAAFAAAYTAADCAACEGNPVYRPGQGIGLAGGQNSNFVVGVNGLIFDRNHESHRSVSTNAAGDRLYTTDADHDAMGGFEVSLQKRNCNNRGWEASYWGLYPGTATASLTGAPVYLTNNWRGLDQLNHLGSGATVWDIFQQGDVQTVYRETSINNIEFNLLNNAGCYTTRFGRRATAEVMFGFRWFDFDETLGVSSDSTFAGYPATLTYNSEVENSLLGFQMGGRSEICLGQKWRLNGTTKMGIYNNRINANQSIFDDAGAFPQIGSGAYAGSDYAIGDQKDDLAFLGELDLGLSRQFSAKSRFLIGFRAVGVSGVALADSQIPYDYTDVSQIGRTHSDSALLLYGGYAGLEFCR